jgi:hypothetical protein
MFLSIRDNIATDEELGMPTTAGSFALLGMPVKKDAFIVRKLREAGAISESTLFPRRMCSDVDDVRDMSRSSCQSEHERAG